MSTQVSTYVKPEIAPAPVSWRVLRLQRKCACGGDPGPSGECENCRKKRLQKRSAISDPGNAFEREADRAADAVTAGKAVPALSAVNGGEEMVVPPIVHEVLQDHGQSIDAKTRQTMGRGFGHDFGNVCVHHDRRADESARAVHAHAYTVGTHVVFAAGRYAPATRAGQTLLAHELAHVAQQTRRSSAVTSLQRAPAGSSSAPLTAEEEAQTTGGQSAASKAATAPARAAPKGNTATADDVSCRGSADKHTGTQVLAGKYPASVSADFGSVFNPMQRLLDGEGREMGRHFPILNGKALRAEPSDVALQMRGPEIDNLRGVKLQADGDRFLASFNPGQPPNLAASAIVLPALNSGAANEWLLPKAEAHKVANLLATLADEGAVPIQYQGTDDDCRNRTDPLTLKVSHADPPAQVIREHEQRHAEDWQKNFCRVIGRRDRRITNRIGAENARAGSARQDPAKAEERALRKLYQGIDPKVETAAELIAGEKAAAKRLHSVSRLNFQFNNVTVTKQCDVVLINAGIRPRGGEETDGASDGDGFLSAG